MKRIDKMIWILNIVNIILVAYIISSKYANPYPEFVDPFKYEYFVVYKYTDTYRIGYSRIPIKRTSVIDSMQDITGLETYIGKRNKYEDVYILYWKRFEENTP